jgi:hypothetical protein
MKVVKKAVTLSITLYILGLTWIFLFPLISISTGESKPRQLFVDEHALLTTTFSRPNVPLITLPSSKYYKNNVNIEDVCNVLELVDISQCFTSSISNSSIIVIDIHPTYRPSNNEYIVLVIPVLNDHISLSVMNLVATLLLNLQETMWMSKNVMCLFVPYSNSIKDSNRYSETLAKWLDRYYSSITFPQRTSETKYWGTLRHAIILDFYSDNNWYINNNSHSIHSTSQLTPYKLHFSGINGVLPNMDVISAVLSMAPDHISIGTGKYGEEMRNQNTNNNKMKSAKNYYIKPVYENLLYDLFSFCSDLLKGSDGWHAIFLSHNIDAITIRTTGAYNTQNSNSNSSVPIESLVYEPERFLSLIYSVIRTYNTLHGMYCTISISELLLIKYCYLYIVYLVKS